VAVDHGGREVDELAVIDPRAVAQHLERNTFVDPMAFHQDPLGPLDQRTATERALQIVIFREPAQHDVDRALPILNIII